MKHSDVFEDVDPLMFDLIDKLIIKPVNTQEKCSISIGKSYLLNGRFVSKDCFDAYHKKMGCLHDNDPPQNQEAPRSA